MSDTSWCSQCKRNLPRGDFLSFADRTVKVRYCSPCAQKNMQAYWAMRATVTDPAKMAKDARA